jgi:transposase-like protein
MFVKPYFSCYHSTMSDADDSAKKETAQKDANAKQAIAILGARPPLPPTAQDPEWTWTPARLKAVYLEAFTDIEKKQIAEMCDVHVNTLFAWRKQGDYKRYMAELVYSDGVAEKVQRNKTRKTVADGLLVAIMDKLKTPGALAGEKVSALVKSFNDILTSLGDDVTQWQDISEAAQAGRPAKSDGAGMADYIKRIEDPEERETLRRHLLEIFKAQIDRASARPSRQDTGIIEAETVPDEPLDSAALDTETAPPAPEPADSAELDPSALE